MKRTLSHLAMWVLAAGPLMVAGCDSKPTDATVEQTQPEPPASEPEAEPPAPKPAPSAAKTPAAAPGGGYLETVVRQPARMKVKFNMLGLKQSLEAYNALHGEYPKTLKDLNKEGLTVPEAPPGKAFKYDAKIGKVELVDK